MPKKIFWPISLIIMGLLFLSGNLGAVPQEFWNLWPLLLIIVGLGGLLTADRDEWIYEKTTKVAPKRAVAAKKSTKRKK